MTIPYYYYLLGYISTNIILFMFPTILHKKIKTPKIFEQSLQGKKILRIAHRGGPRLTTQNTIQAFRKVVHVSDMLQMDVCQTKDGVLVVHHDQSLQRTCGVNKKVSQLDYKDLPKFKDQIDLDFADNMKIVSNNQKIPTLQEVFKIFQGIPMNIQLKTPSQNAIGEFARLLQEYDRQQITVCGIRNSKMQLFEAIAPEVPKFANDKSVLRMLFLYYTGLLPFFTLKFETFQYPVFSNDFHQRKLQQNKAKNGPNQWKINLFFKLLPYMNWTFKPLLYHLKKRGIVSLAWVCNNQDDFDWAIQIGSCGIMTDTPFQLDQYLKKIEKKNQ